jgi:superfamily II DNA helicase RecQ
MEEALAREVLDELRGSGRSVGKLHTELCSKNGLDRDGFEELIGAMARAGLVHLVDSVFEKDGKQIPYRKATLTRDAAYVSEDTPLELSIRGTARLTKKKGRTRKVKAAVTKAARKKRRDPSSRPVGVAETQAHSESKAEPMLKEWRREKAQKLGVPAFRIMSDRVLLAIAENLPRSAAELLAIPGIGIATVEKYGAQLYRILNQVR